MDRIILRWVLQRGRDSGISPCPGPTPIGWSATSRGADGVGLGVAVGEDLEEVDQVGLLRGGQLQIAHLAVYRPYHPGGPMAADWAGVRPATFCTLSRTSGGGKSGV